SCVRQTWAGTLRREICVSSQSVNRQRFVRLRCETVASRAGRLRFPKPQQPFPRAYTASVVAHWVNQTDHAVQGSVNAFAMFATKLSTISIPPKFAQIIDN